MKKYFRSWFAWIPILAVLLYFTVTKEGVTGIFFATLLGIAGGLCFSAIKESARTKQ